MKKVETIEDVYLALDELVGELKGAGELQLAAILHHRLHEVAWAVRSELLNELNRVLAPALESGDAQIPSSLREQIGRVLLVIGRYRT